MAEKVYNDTVVIIGGITVVAAISVAIMVTKQRKKKIYAQIEQKIQTGTNIIGSESSKAFDISYWKTADPSKLITVPQANTFAKGLRDMYAYLGSNDDGIVTIIKQLKNLAQLSQVANAYYLMYSETLQDFLKRAVDRSFLGLGSSGHMDIINKYIASLN